MCFSACHWARIGTIVYGAGIADARGYGFRELTISNEEMKKKGKSGMRIIRGFLREENIALFRLWAGKKNSRVY
jgi:tRNA(Arg) A34 adenosine deaminase TadA